MATSDLDVRFTCGLCMEPYRDRTPKILPCFHTFCLPCLEDIVKSVASKETDVTSDDDVDAKTTGVDGKKERESTGKKEQKTLISTCAVELADDKEAKKKVRFRCPTCRGNVLVPAGGVSQFQTNFYLNVDEPSESTESTPQMMCDTCEKGSRDKATHECADCRNKMCSSCSRLHGMFAQLKGHRVRALDARSHGMSTSRVLKPRECPSHAGQPLSFHCRQCDVSICLHCKLTSHEGHATEDFIAATTRVKEELSRLIVTANQQIHVLDGVLGRLERDSLELSRQKQEMMSSITSRYEALVSWATRARDEALEEMECVERAALKEIEAERVVARDTKQMLSHLVARATYSCQTDPDLDIVLQKSDLQAALLKDDTVARYRKRGIKEGHVTFFTCRSDSKGVQLDQVRDFVGRQEGQERNEKDTMEVMSVRELSEKALEMEKSLDNLKNHMKRENGTKSVAFKVSPSASFTVPAANTVLVFDEVDFNEGDCYDKTTGIFTAPVNGTYVFLANLFTNCDSYYGYCSLSVDGNKVDFMNVVNKVGMLHNIISLNAGQEVSLLSNDPFGVFCDKKATFYTGALLCAKVVKK